MKFSILMISAFASLAVTQDGFLDRRGDSSCAPGNNCQRGVGGTNGKPALNTRLADCSALNTVTVIPATVTETVHTNTIAIRIPTGLPVKRQPDGSPAAPADAPVAEAVATTIYPTATPTYATYCRTATAYYSACSCAGVTAVTTTAPAPTTTVTQTNDGCPVRRAVKRAGEAIGYEYSPRWEEYHIPGHKLF